VLVGVLVGCGNVLHQPPAESRPSVAGAGGPDRRRVRIFDATGGKPVTLESRARGEIRRWPVRFPLERSRAGDRQSNAAAVLGTGRAGRVIPVVTSCFQRGRIGGRTAAAPAEDALARQINAGAGTVTATSDQPLRRRPPAAGLDLRPHDLKTPAVRFHRSRRVLPGVPRTAFRPRMGEAGKNGREDRSERVRVTCVSGSGATAFSSRMGERWQGGAEDRSERT
jgi:hypothetical protein